MRRRSLANDHKRAPGCLSFFALPFLGFGLVALGFAGKLVFDHARAGLEYVETTCVIVGKRLVESHDSDGSTYRPEFTFRFEAGGETVETTGYSIAGFISTSDRRGSERALARFEVGSEYPCWYDPNNPRRALLTRAFPTFVFVMALLFGAVFTLIGGAILVAGLQGIGSRRSGSRALRSGAPRLPLPEIPKGRPPPGVMRDLVPETRFAAAGCSLLAFAIVWNGILSVFLAMMAREWIAGRRPWLFTLFLVPFVGVGLLVAVGAAHRFLVAGVWRRLAVQADRQVVRPGERIRVAVVHAGEYVIGTWTASLVCREKVSYTRGTDTRDEDRLVYEEIVDETAGLSVAPARPLRREFGAAVPAKAMHSFETANNRIVWSIRLKAAVRGRPDLDAEYPLIVIPPGAQEAA